MRRAKRITALAVAAAMVLSNVAYAAPDTGSVATQTGAESAESLNSQSGTSGGAGDQASESTGNGTSGSSSQQSDQQAVTQNDDTQTTTPDVGEQTDSQSVTEETKEKETSTTEDPAAASESQQEQSQDTEETKTEEEKVLYDIKFETPEKHGKVTDMDGNEVADGKTLKTDESGKVRFKVKVDGGYQVEKVINKSDKSQLNLISNSYYELQVDKNMTVEVHYKKIPAKEAGNKNTTNDTKDSNSNREQMENVQKQTKISANFLNISPTANKNVSVSFVDENGSTIQDAPESVTTGICKEIAESLKVNPALQGYDYVKATVDNDEIYSIGSVDNTLYYVPIEDQSTGLLLEGKQVVFHYEKHVETYKIEYNTTLEKDGPNEVKAGKSYSFTVKPSGKGKKTSSYC